MPIKYIVFTFLAIFFCLNFYAQSPEGFNYQAVLRLSNGNISANKITAGTMSALSSAGSEISYCLVTSGDAGDDDLTRSNEE